MGLPAKWNDPTYGWCFTLWAAIDTLKKRRVTCTNEGKTLICQVEGKDPVRIEPVHIAAMGWMYPQIYLDRLTVTNVFFELFGTLIDGQRLIPCYAAKLGQVLCERYGGTPQAWMVAHLAVVEDWDSYHDDLDFGGDEGLAHFHEGLYRTTRALFRLTETPELSHEDMKSLSLELPALASAGCDALIPGARAAIQSIYAAGYRLHLTTHALNAQARALLQAGDILPYFNGQLFGLDITEQYVRDAGYFSLIAGGLPPEQCLIVTHSEADRMAAQAAGWSAAPFSAVTLTSLSY